MPLQRQQLLLIQKPDRDWCQCAPDKHENSEKCLYRCSNSAKIWLWIFRFKFPDKPSDNPFKVDRSDTNEKPDKERPDQHPGSTGLSRFPGDGCRFMYSEDRRLLLNLNFGLLQPPCKGVIKTVGEVELRLEPLFSDSHRLQLDVHISILELGKGFLRPSEILFCFLNLLFNKLQIFHRFFSSVIHHILLQQITDQYHHLCRCLRIGKGDPDTYKAGLGFPFDGYQLAHSLSYTPYPVVELQGGIKIGQFRKLNRLGWLRI